KALHDSTLQAALNVARGGFVDKRQAAVDALPEFEALKARAKAIKNHTLDNLSDYLLEFERAVIASGGQVHWAQTTEQANRAVLEICAQANARRVTKGKSMISEEMKLNHALEAAGFDVTETDLGEYIIQLANETPSHIIAPAVHKTKAQVEALFDEFHEARLPANRSREQLVSEARARLREAFLSADVGITGSNFLIAETGSSVLVTNEGNGDLTASIPGVHIVTASIDKIIPKLEDLPTFLRLLGRSATGQELTAYTTLFTGPRHAEETAGPEQFHVILLDNGRSDIRNSGFRDALRCIRCGACINHCAVYGAVGGHAYNAVYPGPIGLVMTPLLYGLDSSLETLSACTMNGHCKVACPMSIPLSDLIRKHRIAAFEQHKISAIEQQGLALWKKAALKPGLYRKLTGLSSRAIQLLGRYPVLQKITPFLGNWKKGRTLMKARGRTFQSLLRSEQKND
ncbi:MAG: lactate utilization protein, partial [Proteobacteria bacterium]|nr:lactate utilization protein [Pseudomonadota bacterium]